MPLRSRYGLSITLLFALGSLAASFSVSPSAQATTPPDRSALFQQDWTGTVRPAIKVDLVCVALSDNDGGRPCATNPTELEGMQQVIKSVYGPTGIQFQMRSLNGRSTLLNSLDQLDELKRPEVAAAVGQLRRANHIDDTALVALFRFGSNPSKANGQGVGGFPFRCVLVSALSVTNAGPAMLAHEIGHTLGLGHTFDNLRTLEEATAFLRAHGGDPKCFDGDGLDDTPNDPGLPFLVEHGSVQNLPSDTIHIDQTPIKLPVGNLMSYLGYANVFPNVSPKQSQIVRWHALATTNVNKPEGVTFEFEDMIPHASGSIT